MISADLAGEAIEHPARDREPTFLARNTFHACADQMGKAKAYDCDHIFGDHFVCGMILVQHAASTTLARHSNEALAIGACWVHLVIDDRLGRVTDSKIAGRRS